MMRSGEKLPSKRIVLIACIILLFALLCLIIAVSGRQSQSNTIRVLISTEKSDRLDFAIYGKFRSKSLTLSQGFFSVDLQDGVLSLYDSTNNKLVSGGNLELSPASRDSFVKIYNQFYGQACYSGSIQISADDADHLRLVEKAPTAVFVQSIVSFCGASMPDEAVKALTVITQNYAAACRGNGSFYDTTDVAFPYAGILSGNDGFLSVMKQVIGDRLVSDHSYIYPELRSSNGGVYRILPSSPEESAMIQEDRYDGLYAALPSGIPSGFSGSCISLQSLRARAAAGQSYEEILSFYFPYASLVRGMRSVRLSDYSIKNNPPVKEG